MKFVSMEQEAKLFWNTYNHHCLSPQFPKGLFFEFIQSYGFKCSTPIYVILKKHENLHLIYHYS